MILRYREDRKRWEVYVSPASKELDLYRFCWRAFGEPSLDNGWDQHGGNYVFTNPEYVTMVKLRFGL